MNGFLDWRQIELQNDWGVREKTDAMGEMWDRGASMWDARWKGEEEFTRRQAAAFDLLPGDTVLDVGCGTGPLTMNVAPRVKRVVAMDYGRDMLALLRDNARARGLDNVETLQGNWYTMEPGEQIPVCDVAITRWSPAHGDILKFSRCAARWCYSIESVTPEFEKDGHSTGGYWCRSTVDESLNTTPRPCGRKYGFNVHFNLLYDHGANPTVNYVSDERVETAATLEELAAKVFGAAQPPNGAAGAARDPHGLFARCTTRNGDGSYTFRRRHTVAVMGWDPNEVAY